MSDLLVELALLKQEVAELRVRLARHWCTKFGRTLTEEGISQLRGVGWTSLATASRQVNAAPNRRPQLPVRLPASARAEPEHLPRPPQARTPATKKPPATFGIRLRRAVVPFLVVWVAVASLLTAFSEALDLTLISASVAGTLAGLVTQWRRDHS